MLTEHGTQIAPSTFYAHQARGFTLSERELLDAYDANTLHALWVTNRRLYGRRKLWKAARRGGYDWGRDRIERLMRIAGISGVRRGRRGTITTVTDPKAPRHPDYIRRRWNYPTRPDQWWVADFTYVWTTAGFCYVSFITDVFSRMILGWRVFTRKGTALVQSALEQALFTRRRTRFEFTAEGLLHHSDAGSEYTSLAFTEALGEAGITGSIGSVGDALDNALMESTVGLYKTEVIDHERPTWSSWRQVEAATAEWVHWYNHDRLHSSIEDLPPEEFEQIYYDKNPRLSEPAAA